MFAESEIEFRDLVVQNLESCGFLNKIKAELRAGVFLALSEDGNFRNKIPLINKKFDDFFSTDEGKLTVSIVREFLEYFNLTFTLSVLEPEIGNSNSCLSRAELLKKLNLTDNEIEEPVILSLVKPPKPSGNSENLFSNKNKKLDSISEKALSKNKNIPVQERTEPSFLEKLCSNSKLGKESFEVKSDKAISGLTNKISSRITTQSSDDSNTYDFQKSESISSPKEHALSSFFDSPLPPEETGFLNIRKSNDQEKFPSSFSHTSKDGLSSLKDLPSLKEQSSKESFSRQLKSSNLVSNSDELTSEELIKKDLDPESNEESSDRQLNSEESIEEEIEEDFSAGLDDLLNSSLSLGEDVTSDQTVSQTSVIEGVDHIESCHSTS